MKTPTYAEVVPYIEKGLVNEQRHPENNDVAILNYSQTCQFSQAWDETTRMCRGLIVNMETGEVLARPFPKFFNYGEHVTKGWAIPTSTPEIYTKLDGSLGILYELNGKPWIATRGSFTSDQAMWATKWWRDHLAMLPEKNETNLFEIIYPENRIVVNYDFSGLVHLATLDTTTGERIERYWGGPIRIPVRYDGRSVADLEKWDEPNSEGFVLFYPEENVRMKVKLAEYVRLHKIVTGLNEIAVWEHLKEGKDVSELIKDVPDEMFKWVHEVATNLIFAHDNIAHDCERIFETVKDLPTRKEQALAIAKYSPKYHGVVFSLLDGHGAKAIQQIWKMVRPHGQHVYKVDIDS